MRTLAMFGENEWRRYIDCNFPCIRLEDVAEVSFDLLCPSIIAGQILSGICTFQTYTTGMVV